MLGKREIEGRLYTYCWGRGRWEGDCITIAGEEGDCIPTAGDEGDWIPNIGEEGDGRETVYLPLGKREMGGRLYTYCWGRGRWEGDYIPIAGEEGDGREIAYLLLGRGRWEGDCIPITGEQGDCMHTAGEEGDWRETVYLSLGKRKNVYISLRCHHQNDSCIKMGSDESHFNVSLVVRDKVTRLSTNHNHFEENGELKQNRAEALLLTTDTSLTPSR